MSFDDTISQSDLLKVTDRLYSLQEDTRLEAVHRLIDIGELAVPLLSNILLEPDEQTRRDRLAIYPDFWRDSCKLAREAAWQALESIGEPAVGVFIKASQNQDENLRARAASALASIGNAQAIEALRDLLHREIAEFHKRLKRWRLPKIAIGLTLVCFLLTPWGVGYISLAIYFLVQLFAAGYSTDTALNTRRKVANALSKMNDVKMVGALTGCLSDEDKFVRQAVSEAIKRLLPQMKASDKQYISVTEMDILVKALGGDDYRLKLAILKALEQVGDERALKKAEELASPNSNQSDEVRRAAEACLPYLRALAEQSLQAQTLLRASAASEAIASDVLLRPAQGTPTTETSQLLRAHNAPE